MSINNPTYQNARLIQFQFLSNNQEQCALNIFFNDNFYTLPSTWNYELAASLVNNTYKFDFYSEYKNQEDSAKVLHFLGRYKPWKNLLEYKADIWWLYARTTPFYEEILVRIVDFRAKNIDVNIDLRYLRNELEHTHFPIINYHDKLSYVMQRIPYFELKKFIYKLKKTFSFGKRHKKYQEKYSRIKNLIKDAKKNVIEAQCN